MRFSAATVLDQVKRGASLQAIADPRSMDDVVEAVRDGKAGLRYGVRGLDEEGLRRRGTDRWSVAEIVGHALAVDHAAHGIARSLALGRMPDANALDYDEPGDAEASRDSLLAGIDAAEARAVEARVLAAGGPAFVHRDLGALDARGWILFIAVHDAMHLHQAAAIVRS